MRKSCQHKQQSIIFMQLKDELKIRNPDLEKHNQNGCHLNQKQNKENRVDPAKNFHFIHIFSFLNSK